MKSLQLALVLGIVSGCHGASQRTVPHAAPAGAVLAVTPAAPEPGFHFRIHATTPAQLEAPKVAAAAGVPLDAAQTQALVARMPQLPEQTTDRAPFALREATSPPPRPGRTVETPFPPPAAAQAEAPPQVSSEPLSVTRSAPQGEVASAPNVSLSFSQPMVAVSSHAQTAGQVPASLTPQPPGKWRWLGTQTLLFQPEAERLPMATDFTVEVPAGTKPPRGAALAQAKRWTFSTPPVKVERFEPQGVPARPEGLMFASFDQRIEPAAVLATITLRAAGRAYELRPASDAEIRADKAMLELTAQAENEGQHARYLVFRSVAPLPAASKVELSIGPGTPSAEGPRKTKTAARYAFETYGPLRVAESSCGWQDKCPPGQSWSVRFSNPLDATSFDPSLVTIEPGLPEHTVRVNGEWMTIWGRARGRTKYKVTLAPQLKDQFGQVLGTAQSVSFAVTPAEPSLMSMAGPMTVLDPALPPGFSVVSVNREQLHVRVLAVQPRDVVAYSKAMRVEEDGRAVTLPGRVVIDTIVQVQGAPDEAVETRIDLAPALPHGRGHVIVEVEPTTRPPKERPWERQLVRSWVQATTTGLTAFADGESLLVWASALADGAPLRDVELSLDDGKEVVRTGSDGLASLPLGKSSRALFARRRLADGAEEVALLPSNPSLADYSGWSDRPPAASALWYVADDRGLYRPGERVRFKGWVRRSGMRKGGDLGLFSEDLPASARVAWTARDAHGTEFAHGQTELSQVGGFSGELELPKAMPLGQASIEFGLKASKLDQSYAHGFAVQEFRRPEFEVNVSAGAAPYFVGEPANVTAEAKYYTGSGLPNAEVNWTVSSRAGSFVPPNRSDFSFGIWKPWWWLGGEGESQLSRARTRGRFAPTPSTEAGEDAQTLHGVTDTAGKHALQLEFISSNPPQPTLVEAQASVMDKNHQAWNASSSLLVHPASHYVGLRSDRVFVEAGEPLRFDAIVVDLDGKAVVGRPIAVRSVRVEETQDNGELHEREVDPQSCNVQSAQEAVQCSFVLSRGGEYRISASITDERGRPNFTQVTRWVAGEPLVPTRALQQEQVTLIPNQQHYQPGETAQLLVMSPFYPAEGTLTLRRSGLIETRRFAMSGPSHTLQVPITDAYTPNLIAQVDLVGSSQRIDVRGKPDPRAGRRPAFASGSQTLDVPPRTRTLALDVVPRERSLAPGGSTLLDVTVRDDHAQPVAGAELLVVVVDEALLALTGYRLPDPLQAFYPQRDGGVQDFHLRQSLVLAGPQDVAAQAATGGGAGGESDPYVARRVAVPSAIRKHARLAQAEDNLSRASMEMEYDEAKAPGQAGTPISMRSDFNALALFAPALRSDERGHVEVKVKLPDNLTRYRVMVVAAQQAQRFGSGESAITARLPLMVRPSAPRFLNFGDRFELPVLVQNGTDHSMQVDVAVRAGNAEPSVPWGRRVSVPAGDRVELRVPAAAAQPGTARFAVAAVSGSAADAAALELPVWTPVTREAFATYGVIDEGPIAQPIAAPTAVVPQFGGLELTTSSTALQGLTDAVLYLVKYPFECSEQLASRVLAIATLRDVLAAFHAEGLPPSAQLTASLQADFERLRQLQGEAGGWGFWRADEASWPYLTIHVTHALARAKHKGFAVPAEMLSRATLYVQHIEQHIPRGYGPAEVRNLKAHALYVRKQLGDRDPAAARALFAQSGGAAKLDLETLALLYAVLAGDAGSSAELGAIRKQLQNRVEETAGAAHFASDFGSNGYLVLHCARRADAIMLEALIDDQPKSELIPKLVTGLLAHRKAGRWESTQENAFVLAALDRYFRRYEAASPDFVARAWLGTQFAGEQKYQGRSTDRQQLEVPMAYLMAHPASELTLQKQGKGRMYYRVGMQYAPQSLTTAPADDGFSVERNYEAVDAPADVRRNGDGSWHIRAGARVRVRIAMAARARRYHVALVDPLPAGLEALNPALAVTGALPSDPERDATSKLPWWWRSVWYEHQNLRDERAEAFTSLLSDGVHEYTYYARATTSGTFIVPPPHAEEMYHPETAGHGASDRVIIE